MRKMLIIALLFFIGYNVNAQSTDLSYPESLLVGTWEVQQDKQEIRLKSLVFFADGTINFDFAGLKRIQRYKILKDEQGFSIQLLEIISGKPLEKISILKFSKEEMELGAKDDTVDITVRCKKVST